MPQYNIESKGFNEFVTTNSVNPYDSLSYFTRQHVYWILDNPGVEPLGGLYVVPRTG